MNGWKRPAINLATHPLRNQRFFTSLIAALSIVFAALAGPAGFVLVRSSIQRHADDAVAADLEGRAAAADRERHDQTVRADSLSKANVEIVAHVNAAINRKRFSLVEFFSRLEEALPPGCEIAGAAPLQPGEDRLEARLTVIVPGLQNLLALINKLHDLGFKSIRFENETQVGGRLICDIGFVYERTL